VEYAWLVRRSDRREDCNRALVGAGVPIAPHVPLMYLFRRALVIRMGCMACTRRVVMAQRVPFGDRHTGPASTRRHRSAAIVLASSCPQYVVDAIENVCESEVFR